MKGVIILYTESAHAGHEHNEAHHVAIKKPSS